MDWTTNFIIPVTKLTTLLLIGGGLSFVLARFLYIKWNKDLKWNLKYKKSKPSTEIIELLESIKDLDNENIKRTLLVQDFTIKQINELLYLKKLFEGKK